MQTADPATRTGSPRRWWAVLAPAAALVLAALCLRAPFSAVGPVLGELGDELSLPQAALSVLPTLPLVCFGLVSPVAPALAARLGVHRAVLAGLVVLAAGIATRTGASHSVRPVTALPVAVTSGWARPAPRLAENPIVAVVAPSTGAARSP